jgi:hypothetical protein
MLELEEVETSSQMKSRVAEVQPQCQWVQVEIGKML